MSEEKSILGAIVDTLLGPQDPTRRVAYESAKLQKTLDRMAEEQTESASALLGAQSAGVAAQSATLERVALLESQVKLLERNLAATALYCRAILQVLHERGVTTPAQFREHFDRLDMLDGVKDGR